MCDALGNLVMGLGDVCRAINVSDVTHRERLAQIDSVLVAVLLVESGNAPHALRPKPRSRAERRGNVERDAYERHVVIAHFPYVLEVGRPHEGIYPRPMRQAAALKTAKLCLVFDRIDRLQPEFLYALILRSPFR
jgi:hypothetical protein